MKSHLRYILRQRSIMLMLLLIACSITLTSCQDDSLTRMPQDQISNEDYWTSPNDLRLYVNQFYPVFPGFSTWHPNMFYEDGNSDNMAPISDPASNNNRVAGRNTISSGSEAWSNWYTQIRDVNFMLTNAGNNNVLEDQESLISMGEAHFFRAYFFFQLVKNFGDVPWINKPLDTESEELYGPQTPRNQVIDSILVDLDYAITHIPPKSQTGGNRLNKETALLFKSRVALFEGTWEKYHQGTPFGVEGSNGQQYLQVAAEAAETLIDMGTAEIHSTGNPATDYSTLFNQDNLSGNPEVLLWKDYNADLDIGHNVQRRMPRHGGGTGLTKALVEAFLADDGQPIAVSNRYQGDETLNDIVANRDPRLGQVLKVPGDTMWVNEDGSVQIFEKPMLQEAGVLLSTTGYELEKGAATDRPIPGQHLSETAAIVFRYAEALLNYAEAKAELGEITQQDLNITINKLRDRAGMPHLVLSDITTDPNWDYPDLSPVLNEIRRERRIEFVCEGYRLDDILRWAAADEVIANVQPLGYKFNSDNFPNAEVGVDVFVNDDGYLEPYQNTFPNGWGFDISRDYLLPIPPTQITLNDQLDQNPGW